MRGGPARVALCARATRRAAADAAAAWREPVATDASVSVVIPARNEADALAQSLRAAQEAAAAGRSARRVEFVVASGASSDATERVAREMGCLVVRAPPTRAQCLNAGAAAARGSVLVFMHADTRLPPGFADLACEALAGDRVVCAAFAFKLAPPVRGGALVEWGTNLRARWLQLPYGDQALCVRRSTWAALGGFPAQPFMEDFDFVRALRLVGRVSVIDAPALTSSRRWAKLGVARTLLTNQAIIAAHLLGAAPERVHQWYYGRAAGE